MSKKTASMTNAELLEHFARNKRQKCADCGKVRVCAWNNEVKAYVCKKCESEYSNRTA